MGRTSDPRRRVALLSSQAGRLSRRAATSSQAAPTLQKSEAAGWGTHGTDRLRHGSRRFLLTSDSESQFNSTWHLSAPLWRARPRGLRHLIPFILCEVVIHCFAFAQGTAWAEGNGLTITTRTSSESRFGPRFGPFADNDNDEKVKTGGGESANYRIVSTKGNLVSIAKTHKMTSPSAGGDDPGFNSDGSGTWVFNKTDGVSESMDFKTQMTVSMENAEVRIPVSITWKRIPVPEYEAHIKERQERLAALQAEAKARHEKAAKEAREKEGKQLTAKVKKEVLTDLNAKDWVTISRRLDTMKGYVPHPNDFDIASRVKELTKHNVPSVTFSAKQVWKTIEPVIAAADEAAAASSEDNPFATDGEKMEKDLNTVREWSDRSGSFKVEAAFVRLENGTVVLKRKDGKEVKVPLSRLNPDDRELAESFGKE